MPKVTLKLRKFRLLALPYLIGKGSKNPKRKKPFSACFRTRKAIKFPYFVVINPRNTKITIEPQTQESINFKARSAFEIVIFFILILL